MVLPIDTTIDSRHDLLLQQPKFVKSMQYKREHKMSMHKSSERDSE